MAGDGQIFELFFRKFALWGFPTEQQKNSRFSCARPLVLATTLPHLPPWRIFVIRGFTPIWRDGVAPFGVARRFCESKTVEALIGVKTNSNVFKPSKLSLWSAPPWCSPANHSAFSWWKFEISNFAVFTENRLRRGFKSRWGHYKILVNFLMFFL